VVVCGRALGKGRQQREWRRMSVGAGEWPMRVGKCNYLHLFEDGIVLLRKEIRAPFIESG